jgi:shikimate dehydrogenase
MQGAALAAAGLSGWTYQKLPVPPDLFDETVRALPGTAFAGANVTIPHKEAALAVADDATDAARQIGAANTLTFAGGAIAADNTDAPGLIAALPIDVRGRTALVLGAGGSARAAVWALTGAGAAEVRVWNRTPERARRLAAELGAQPVDRAEPADLLVHCTAAGLDKNGAQLKTLPLGADHLSGYACVVDLVYRPGGTDLVSEAARRGVVTVDGLDVLVHQGALSFEHWTGQPAPLEAMQAAARAAECSP